MAKTRASSRVTVNSSKQPALRKPIISKANASRVTGTKARITKAATSPSLEPTILFPDEAAFDSYLTNPPPSPPLPSAIHLQIAKKASPTRSVSYDQAVITALAHGWIDGQRRTHPSDPTNFFVQRFTPRRAGSTWSKRNVGIVETLIAEGRMRAGGMEEVRMAKEDGRWGRAYEGSKDMVVRPEFEDVLRKGEVWGRWEELGKGERYTYLIRIETAKEGSREKVMQRIVEAFRQKA